MIRRMRTDASTRVPSFITRIKVNAERSSRADALKKRFKINEMSSISTLEFVWENKSLWPSWWDETDFC